MKVGGNQIELKINKNKGNCVATAKNLIIPDRWAISRTDWTGLVVQVHSRETHHFGSFFHVKLFGA